MISNITIQDLREILPASHFNLGEDIIFSTLEQDDLTSLNRLQERFRFDGFLSLILCSGNLTIEVNHCRHHLRPLMYCATQATNVVQLYPPENAGRKFKLVVVAVTKEWIFHSYANVYKLFAYGSALRQLPVITLTQKEFDLLHNYYVMLKDVTESQRPWMEENLRFISSSALCEISACWKTRIDELQQEEDSLSGEPGSLNDPSMMIFNHFMALAAKYYLTERKMSFYVDKLHISHQHLSRVVKQVSGSTPMHQIDNFLIMEAKNMLTGTRMSIKEIAATLNFTNQAVFYRVFKRITGYMPTEFRHLSEEDTPAETMPIGTE